MISENRTHLSSYLTGLLSSGRAVFCAMKLCATWGAVRGLFSTPRSVSNAAVNS